jgi:hypothetical protein
MDNTKLNLASLAATLIAPVALARRSGGSWVPPSGFGRHRVNPRYPTRVPEAAQPSARVRRFFQRECLVVWTNPITGERTAYGWSAMVERLKAVKEDAFKARKEYWASL